MIGTTRPTAMKLWHNLFIVITFLIYHRTTLMSTTSSVQFVFGFSQYHQQKHASSCSLFRNQDRTLHSFIDTALRPSVNVQRSYVVSMISDLQQPESSQRWFLNKITYHRLRRWYTQKLSPLLHQSRKLILTCRYYLWFLGLFLSWNIAIPNAIATTKTTVMTTRMLRSIRPPRTNSVNDGTLTNHHDTGTFMIGTATHEGNSFHANPNGHKNNLRQIRFITTSAVILATSAVGVNKVNRKKQTNDNSMDSEDDPTIIVDDQDVTTTSGSELAWLLPKNDDTGSSEDEARVAASSMSNVGTVKPSSTPILSQRTNEITNVVERLKQVSLPPTKTESSWFAKSVVKSVLPKQQLLQQPKSIQDELHLQAKYASIESLEERAYTILVDLGMVEEPTPQDPFDSAWE